MNKVMRHAGTVLTVVCVAALIGSVIWVVQNVQLRETQELGLEIRDEMLNRPQEEVALRHQGGFYVETYGIFMMDDQLDEGECGTLRDLAEPLADRIANASPAVRDYAEGLGNRIDRVEEACR